MPVYTPPRPGSVHSQLVPGSSARQTPQQERYPEQRLSSFERQAIDQFGSRPIPEIQKDIRQQLNFINGQVIQ